LNCCGGHAAGVTITRDSNTGGVPTSTGQANGPTIQLGGVGAGGIGDLLMAFSVRQFNGPLGTNCLTATFGPPSTQLWTTANATAQVIRPLQGGPTLTFGTNGEAFDCAAWTTEHGPGAFVSAEVNLNAIAGADAATVRKLDD
jgi:hypothetical protein